MLVVPVQSFVKSSLNDLTLVRFMTHSCYHILCLPDISPWYCILECEVLVEASNGGKLGSQLIHDDTDTAQMDNTSPFRPCVNDLVSNVTMASITGLTTDLTDPKQATIKGFE